ncbi:ribonuclease E activity regulator RraA [Mesorhizobium sp. B4-1-4]|uniref:ribonuclease E activity regulator RraA n=1 Tax=Mesorhizobium sp. B4-1-4 TaxID=2589888 RepID=UPI00112CCB55|nr:ribonuclease E activity regulator RraA [Mesorhizobium sp. B4-1-4]UCI32040.1 ribonuclease E activity regulator RraA [Mesorhizobium sp. B4-1-4]
MTAPVIRFPSATADLCDLFAERARIVDLPWRSFGGKASFQGPAATFAAQDDTALIRRLLEQKGEGRLLVIDNRGSRQHAVFGDHFAALVLENGWAGVIVNGLIRDAQALHAVNVGLAALGTCPRKPRKQGAGEGNVILDIAGATIAPGDWVAADADGVVVIDAAELKQMHGVC